MPTEITTLPDGVVEVFLDDDPVAFYNHETCMITWNPEVDALPPRVVDAIEALTGEHDELCANSGPRYDRDHRIGGWLDEGPVDDGVATVAPMEWAPVLVRVNPDGSAAYLCEGCANRLAEAAPEGDEMTELLTALRRSVEAAGGAPAPVLPTVSAAQGRALAAANDAGTVKASDRVMRPLVREKLVSDPDYGYGRRQARAVITELGRAVVAKRAGAQT